MIKASSFTDGQPLMLLGLSRENCERLLLGEPILFDASVLGLPPVRVVIVGGETEQAIIDELAQHNVITRPNS